MIDNFKEHSRRELEVLDGDEGEVSSSESTESASELERAEKSDPTKHNDGQEISIQEELTNAFALLMSTPKPSRRTELPKRMKRKKADLTPEQKERKV